MRHHRCGAPSSTAAASNATKDVWDARLFRAGLLASMVVIGVLAIPLLTGEVYVHDDLGNFHLPQRKFYADCLASGDEYVWTPYLYSGFYLHGEGQVAMYHPLNQILYRVFPLDVAFNLEILASYPTLLLGMFLLLRRQRLRRGASMFGSLVFGFSSFNLLHLVHMNAIANVAHLPWLLVAIDVAMRDPSARRASVAALGVTFLTASQILHGHPQTVWLSAMVELCYALFILRERRSGWRLVALGQAQLLALMVGGVQLLPSLDAVAASVRADLPEGFRSLGSLHPVNLVQAVAPYLFETRVVGEPGHDVLTHEYGGYMGALVPIWIAWVAIRWRELARWRWLLLGAAGLGALGLALAFGKYLPPIHEALLVLPFRLSARSILLTQFAVSLIAAVALEDLSRRAVAAVAVPWAKLVPLLLVPVVGVLVIAWAYTGTPVANTSLRWDLSGHAGLIWCGPLLLAAGVALVAIAGRGHPTALVVLILFVAADQATYGASYFTRTPPTTLAKLEAAVILPPDGLQHRYRVIPETGIPTMRGVRLENGYAALAPRRELALGTLRIAGESESEQFTRKALQVSGVRGVIRGGRVVARSRGWLATPLPRVRMVTEARTFEDLSRSLLEIDPAQTALVSEQLELRPGRPGGARIVEDRPGRINVETGSTSRQLLVLSESHHEGWRAAVDGQPAPIVRTYGDYMGIVVDAGEHTVALHFQPQSLRDGRRLTYLGLSLTLLIFLATYGLMARGTRSADREARSP